MLTNSRLNRHNRVHVEEGVSNREGRSVASAVVQRKTSATCSAQCSVADVAGKRDSGAMTTRQS